MNKIFLIVGVCLLVISSFLFLNSSKDVEEQKSPVYQGPVRPTDDEAYFRQTGITRPLEVKE